MSPIRLDPPDAVRWIAARLEDRGHETWAVGGAIRDALLELEPGDWDLTTRARPDELRRIFRRSVPIGIDHGTVGVIAPDDVLYEVTTFRRDVETTGRHAVVEFADSVDEDLARRDFTINAVAWHPIREELHDPFGGLADLSAGVVRTVGDPERRFAEDYLRVLRALRFAGHFLLTVEVETWRALSGASPRLDVLSPERVREELMKILSSAERPSAGLSLYAASGALGVLYPELDAAVGREPAAGPGGAGDAWSRALRAMDRIPARRPHLRLVVLLSVVAGEGGSPDAGTGRSARGRTAARVAGGLLERLRFSNAEVRDARGLLEHLFDPPAADAPPPELRRWLSRAGARRLPDLTRLWGAFARADARAGAGDRPGRVTARWRALREVLRDDPPLEIGDLAVDGSDLIELGLEPGPRFGAILRRLLQRVVEEPGLNERTSLLELVREETEAGEAGDGEGGASG